MNQEESRYDQFVKRWKQDPDQFREDLKGDGTYEYMAQVEQLERLSAHLSARMMTYMFGDFPGNHLWEKFARSCDRNLLFFLTQLTVEYRMFILYELKTNETLFAYS